MKYSVYWIKAPHHTDPLSEGYVGVTNNPERRFREHRAGYTKAKVSDALKKYPNAEMVLLKTNLEKETACIIEAEYRPENNIGWNLLCGGGMPPDHTGRKYEETRLASITGKNNPFYGHTHTAETRQKIADSRRGENNPLYGKRRPCHSKTMAAKRGTEWPRFAGWFVTPEGIFESYREALNATGIKSQHTLYKYCKHCNNQQITTASFAGSKYLKSKYTKSVVGKSYADIGFGFIENGK